MIESSISTITMAVITTNVFLVLLSICLINKELLVNAGHKLLAVFVFLTVLRFALPLEFPFTSTLPLPLSVSRFIALFHIPLFSVLGHSFSLWTLFKWVWAAGTLFGIIKYIISYFQAVSHIILYGKELTKREPYRGMLEQICKTRNRPNRFRVIGIPGLESPMLFGIVSPKILIPEDVELSEKDLSYILRHEASHHFHHDLALKSIVKVITIIYWWDPFCILLNRQADVIFEMRNDDGLTSTNARTTKEYMECLIHMSSPVSKHNPLARALTISLLPYEATDLKKRFFLLCNNQEKTKPALNVLLFLTVASVYMLSYAFVPEAYCRIENSFLINELEQEKVVSISESNSYIIDNGDDTFDVYYKGHYIETVDSLEYYPADIPIYTKDQLNP